LQDICARNIKGEELRDMFKTTCLVSVEWNKRLSCKCLVDKLHHTWTDSHLKLVCHDAESPTLFVYYNLNAEFNEWSIAITDILCAHRLKNVLRPYSFSLLAYSGESVEQKVVLDMENEKALIEWMGSLSKETRQSSDSMSIFATTTLGDIYVCSLTDIKHFDQHRWKKIPGHLDRIVSGSGGVVWAYGYDGVPYCLCDEMAAMHSEEEHFIYENQRWNPVGGYTDRLLPSDRWEWSDVTGVMNCSKESYSLPSTTYRWVDDWKISFDPKQTDNEGWEYAFDFPKTYHNYRGVADYVRRRKWKRTCHVHSTGPWHEIKTDVKIQDVSVSMDTNNYSVWAVSRNGDVLYRDGVSKDNVKGEKWTFVPTQIPVTSVSVGWKSRVWCVANDGSCYMRAGFQDNKKTGTHWFHIPREEQNVCHVSVGRAVVVALDSQGSAYLRMDVNEIYPEGTSWGSSIWRNVSSITVNTNDQVAFSQEGNIFVCLDVLNAAPPTLLLKDCWHDVCLRGLTHHDSPSKVVSPITADDSTTDDGFDDLCESFSTSIDPYAVDIYSFYGNKDGE